MTAYSDMDWEDIVEDICIRGLPEVLWDAASDWQTQFSRMSSITQSLRDGKGDLAGAWKGQAGEAYVNHLETVAKMFEEAERNLTAAPHLLNSAGDSLQKAMAATPIPDNMVDEVAEAHKAWLSSGKVVTNGEGQCVAMYGTDRSGNALSPGAFKEAQDRNWLSSAWHETGGFFADWWSETFGDAEEKARQQLANLNNEYSATSASTRTPQAPIKEPPVGDPYGAGKDAFNPTGGDKSYTPPAGGGGGGPGGTSTAPQVKTPTFDSNGPGTGSGIDPTKLSPGGTGTGTGYSPTGSNPGTGSYPGSGYTPSKFDPTTGLAGAGGGLGTLGGVGTHPGGIGGGAGGFGGGGGGLGGGGLGGGAGGLAAGGGAGVAGGLGAGLKPVGGIGTPVAANLNSTPGGGAGGRAAGGAGMMGGGHGGLGGGEGDGYDTWLTEDDDIWGSGNDAAPPVLGR